MTKQSLFEIRDTTRARSGKSTFVGQMGSWLHIFLTWSLVENLSWYPCGYNLPLRKSWVLSKKLVGISTSSRTSSLVAGSLAHGVSQQEHRWQQQEMIKNRRKPRCGRKMASIRTAWCQEDTLRQIRRGLQFALEDRVFRIGSTIVRRKTGLATGGPLSPSTAASELERPVSTLYSNETFARKIGINIPKRKAVHAIQGCIHLDDTLAMSKIFCHDCLLVTLTRLFSKNLEVGLEEKGGYVHLLHLDVETDRMDDETFAGKETKHGSALFVSPHIRDVDFLSGKKALG